MKIYPCLEPGCEDVPVFPTPQARGAHRRHVHPRPLTGRPAPKAQTTPKPTMVLPLVLPGDWVESAVCASVDPELFFPEKGESTGSPKRICGGCPVKAECLEFAITNGERFGVWGGTSQKDRIKLRQQATA